MVSKKFSRQSTSSSLPRIASNTSPSGQSSILRSSFCPPALQLSLFASVIQSLDTHQLRIHDTITGELKSEYSPVRTRVNCITWGSCGRQTKHADSPPAKKKRRRQEAAETNRDTAGVIIAIGTNDNSIELFSPLESKVVNILHGAHDSGTRDFKFKNHGLDSEACSLGIDGSLILWDLGAKVQVRKFRAPTESISTIAFFNDSVLLASHAASLMNPESPHTCKAFPGFQDAIHTLMVPTHRTSGLKDVTFLAAAQQSRYINAYNVESSSLLGTLVAGSDVQRAVVQEDAVRPEYSSPEIVLAAIAIDGTIEIFKNPFDWDRVKAVESDLKRRSKMSTRRAEATLRIVNSDRDAGPVAILDASFQKSDLVLAIAEGVANVSFEKISWTDEDGNLSLSGYIKLNKTKTKSLGIEQTNGVKDLTRSQINEAEAVVIRGSDLDQRDGARSTQEVIEISSAEERSEDGSSQHDIVLQDTSIAINGIANGHLEIMDSSAAKDREQSPDEADEPSFGDLVRTRAVGIVDVPALLPNVGEQALVPAERTLDLTGNLSLGTVLAQSLRTNDKSLLESCLRVQDLQVVRATIERLASDLAINLLQNLAEKLHNRPGRAGSLLVWVQWTLVAHGGYLASRPDVVKKIAVLHNVVRERAKSLQPLLSLKGKLDMLEAQLNLRRSLQRNNESATGQVKLPAPTIYVEGQEDSSSDSDDDNSITLPASHSTMSSSETESNSSSDMEGDENAMDVDEISRGENSTDNESSDSEDSARDVVEEDVDYDDVDSEEELGTNKS